MIVSTIAHGKLVFERFSHYPHAALDTETQAKPQYADDKKSTLMIGRYQIKIWSMAYKGESYSFPTNLISSKYPSMQEWAEALRPFARNRKVRKVFHNFNYDGNAFKEYDVEFKCVWDTVMGCHFANPNWERDLKSRANLYGRHLAQTSTVNLSDLKELADYAEGDVIATDELYQMHKYGTVVRPKTIEFITAMGVPFKLRNPMTDLVIKPQYEGLSAFDRKVINFQELPVLRAVIRAERFGFPIAMAQIHAIKNQIALDNQKLLVDIYRHAGGQFKTNSTKDLIRIFTKLGIKITAKTKKGKPSVNAASLFFLTDAHPIVKQILKLRQNEKLISTYVSKNGLPRYADKKGRIHATLNSLGARTGRMSSSAPNLQNVPSAKDLYGIRSCFIAPKGQKIICLDYAQIEIRTMAILCKDPEMRRVLSDPEGDIHQNTADQFNVDRSPTAKQINFLMLYGGGSFALSSKLTLEGAPTTPQQGQAYIDRYNEVYAGVREYRKRLLYEHQKKGYVQYLLGRKRYLIDVDWSSKREIHKAETTLSNNINQGSAQDLLKHSISRCDHRCINPDKAVLTKFKFSEEYRALLSDYGRKLEKYRREFRLANVKWLIQVHDETLYACDAKAAPDIAHKIAEVMTWFPYIEPITAIDVPIVVDGGVGDTWAHAKGKKPDHKIEFFGQIMAA